MKILITGSDGLIGTELRKYFPDAYCIDRGQDISNKKNNYIIHTAANCTIRDIIENPELAKENIDLTFEIMEKARKDKSRIFLFSSSRVTEDENPYTASKKFTEALALAYKNCYGLEYIIIRPETVWSREERNRRVINTWIDEITNNRPAIVYGDENKELPPIHVTEFGRIFMDIFNRFESEVYKTLTISGQPRKAIELISAIGDYYNKTPTIDFRDSELTQPQRCKEADITGKISFEEQLRL